MKRFSGVEKDVRSFCCNGGAQQEFSEVVFY